MGDAESFRRSLNPLFLQMQKMELELKCLECLNLLKSPILMPCDHIFCSYCVATFTESLKCPVCMLRCFHKDVRPATHVEKMVEIFKSMKTILSANRLQQELSGAKTSTSEGPVTPVSGNTNAGVKLEEEPVDQMSGKKSSNVHSYTHLSGNLNTRNTRDEAGIHECGMFGSKRCTVNAGEEVVIDRGETCSPPSFGNIKDSDNDSNGQGSEHRTKRSLANCSSMEDLKFGTKYTKEDCVEEPKRQKLRSEHDVRDSSRGIDAKDFSMFNSKSEIKSEGRSNIQPMHTSNYSATNASVECAFCHSFRTTEASGQMLHYLKGKPVQVDQASQPNVVHVHQKCIDWAPQVYFDGDTAMCLETELSRASKIKCGRCGLKGAALGCYMKSCRKSFHVPCAVEIDECRWDCENFLVLCPAHTTHELPCDRFKNKEGIKSNDSFGSSDSLGDLTSARTPQCNERWPASPALSRNWILCGSALSKEEKVLLDKLAGLIGAAVTSSWMQNVTHVIASTDERGACSRTLKVLMAILGGKWILNIDWIKACMEAGHPVAEEPYEISHDVHGCFDGPKNGRIRFMEKAPKLFSGLSFYFCGYFMPGYKGYLEDLVTAGGGTLKKKNDFPPVRDSNAKEISPSAYVVYSVEPPQGCDPDNLSEVLRKQAQEGETFAAETGSRAVAHTLLLDSIAACNLQLNL